MHKSNFYLIWTSLLMLYGELLFGQQLSFRHLGAQQGLRSLTVLNCSIDKYGFMWASTYDGLVRFDGQDVKYYDVSTNPELKSDQIRYVFCDSRNQIWVCTSSGLTMLDENRQMHPQNIFPGNAETLLRFCFEDSGNRIYAMNFQNAFSKGINDKEWRSEAWLDSIMFKRAAFTISQFDKDRFLLIYPSHGVLLVNFKEKRQEAFINIKPANCATRYDEDHILIGKHGNYELILASISDTSQYRTINPPSYFKLNRQHEQIIDIVRAVDNNFYMTTSDEGLLVLDHSLTRYHSYTHDPVDPATIIDNSLRTIITDSTGILMFGSWEGVNYTNVKNQAVNYINYLKDSNGNITDDRVISIAEDKHQRLWLCTRDDVYIYDFTSGLAKTVEIASSVKFESENLLPMGIGKDMYDRMWVVYRYEGIAVFSSDGQMQKFISPDDYPQFRDLISETRTLKGGSGGFVYAGAQDGFYRISEKDFSIDTFAGHPAMNQLDRERIIDIMPEEDGIWLTSSPHGAAWYYSFISKSLLKYNSENGLAHDRAYGITKDLKGNVFVGTMNGLSIIDTTGSIINFKKGDGLASPQIEAIETANDGSVWMTNMHSLLKYDGTTKKIYMLGSRQGIPGVNYVYNSSTKLSSGKIVFGASSGIVVIDPATVNFDQVQASLFVFYRNAKGDEIELASGDNLNFNYNQRQLRFSFALNDLIINDQVTYKYRLSSDADNGWSNPISNSFIDFNLKPGRYELEVEAYDGYEWIKWPDPIRIVIHPPWWKEWWFLTLMFLIAAFGLWAYYRSRINKYKTELVVARQISDLEAKALRAQMNPHFVFNSLNAIQECIVTGRIDEAYSYLAKFSRLLRLVLEHSDVGEITLHEELEVLDLYISLEKLRFKNDMEYRFTIDEELDAEEIRIPPMLIQPHLENAIWHGLRHIQREKLLQLSINEIIPGYLQVIIEDNGIGRTKSALMAQSRLGGASHKSKGKKLSENRIEIIRKTYPLTSMVITDLEDNDGHPSGTRVTLEIPMLVKSTGNTH